MTAQRSSAATGRGVLERHGPLAAPDLLFAEVTNVLWKQVRRREATIQQARVILTALMELPLEVYPSRFLIQVALEIGSRTGRSVYDCLYVALAVLRHCQLVTADRRLYDALRSGPFSRSILWLPDVE